MFACNVHLVTIALTQLQFQRLAQQEPILMLGHQNAQHVILAISAKVARIQLTPLTLSVQEGTIVKPTISLDKASPLLHKKKLLVLLVLTIH